MADAHVRKHNQETGRLVPLMAIYDCISRRKVLARLMRGSLETGLGGPGDVANKGQRGEVVGGAGARYASGNK